MGRGHGPCAVGTIRNSLCGCACASSTTAWAPTREPRGRLLDDRGTAHCRSRYYGGKTSCSTVTLRLETWQKTARLSPGIGSKRALVESYHALDIDFWHEREGVAMLGARHSPRLDVRVRSLGRRGHQLVHTGDGPRAARGARA